MELLISPTKYTVARERRFTSEKADRCVAMTHVSPLAVMLTDTFPFFHLFRDRDAHSPTPVAHDA